MGPANTEMVSEVRIVFNAVYLTFLKKETEIRAGGTSFQENSGNTIPLYSQLGQD